MPSSEWPKGDHDRNQPGNRGSGRQVPAKDGDDRAARSYLPEPRNSAVGTKIGTVRPARTGMNPYHARPTTGKTTLPRARGDEPELAVDITLGARPGCTLSPHKR